MTAKDTFVRGPCRYPGWYNSVPDPLMLTGALKWELRQHFQPDKIRMPMIQDYVWVPNPDDPEEMDVANTQIIIESAEIPRREVAGYCPQILVKRGDIQAPRSGILGTQGVGITPVTGGALHSVMFQGNWSIMVTSEALGVAERVSWEAYLFFVEMENVIREYYRLTRFHAASISEVGVEESEGVEYVVVIQLEIVFNSGWEVAAQAPRIKNIHMLLEE
jgi:hypothetical protein